MVIQEIKKDEECWTWYVWLIDEAKQVLKNQPLWSLHFIHREGNQVAHVMAKYKLSLNDEIIWTEEIPSILIQAVTIELVI